LRESEQRAKEPTLEPKKKKLTLESSREMADVDSHDKGRAQNGQTRQEVGKKGEKGHERHRRLHAVGGEEKGGGKGGGGKGATNDSFKKTWGAKKNRRKIPGYGENQSRGIESRRKETGFSDRPDSRLRNGNSGEPRYLSGCKMRGWTNSVTICA